MGETEDFDYINLHPLEDDLLSEHPATPKPDTPTVENPVEVDKPIFDTDDIRYRDSHKNFKLLQELPNPVPTVLPNWKLKQNRVKATRTARHADFDLRHTFKKNPDLRSTINSKRKSTGQRFNANPTKKPVPLMSLIFPAEMSLATPVLKIDVTPKVTNHSKAMEVPNHKPKATSTVTSKTFVSPKPNETPPPFQAI